MDKKYAKLRRFDEQTQQEIIRQYRSGLSGDLLSKKYMCDWSTISRLLKRSGITIPNRNRRRMDSAPVIEIIDLYRSGLGFESIAKELKSSYSTVRNIILESEETVRPFNPKISVNEGLILSLFKEKGLLAKEIMELTGYSEWCVGSVLRRAGINSRANQNPTEQEVYYNKVGEVTKESWSKYFDKINPKRLKRDRFQYHLDHVFPRIKGFRLGIAPEIIGHYSNLQIIWWEDNIKKGQREGKTKEELLQHYASALGMDS